VVQSEKQWKYCVHITGAEAPDRRAYLQMVFDRDHSLPKTMAPSVGLYDDFAANINKRNAPLQQSMRKLPRIFVNRPLAGAGRGASLVDFNYHYATLRFRPSANAPEHKDISLGFGLTARLRRAAAAAAAGGEVLYAVENWQELCEDPAFDRLLDAWLRNEETI
jgi:cellulose synthase (UDP-forming)